MASKLEQSLADFIEHYGAHTISVGYLNVPGDNEPFYSVSLQRWDDGDKPGKSCGIGHGATIVEALGKAVEKAGLAPVLADEALPELAA